MRWIYLGKGNYNYVYTNEARTRVLKVQQPDAGLSKVDMLLDTALRSVRIWNEVNFGVAEKATLVEHEGLRSPNGRPISKGVGWTAPFVDGTNSTQKEICDALINVFNRSGRVVLDAMVPGNFKTVHTPDGPKVICVDVGMSLKLQKQQEGLMRQSFSSLKVWQDYASSSYLPWFKSYENNSQYSEVVAMTKALFTLQQKFPFITNADFLKKSENRDIITALAKELDNEGPMRISRPILTRLKVIQEEQMAEAEMIVEAAIETEVELAEARGGKDSPSKVQKEVVKMPFDAKRAYLTKIDQYINSRGTIDQEGNFSPSLITRIFRNTDMTNKKISFAFELKQKIQDCSSLADLQAIIEEGINKTTFSDKGLVDEGWFFKSELKKTLNTLYDLIVRSTMDSTDDKKMSNH